MRVAYVIEHFDPSLGGAQTYLAEFLREFVKGPHEVHIYTQSWKAECDGVTFHRVSPNGLLKSKRVLSFASRCERELKKERFDIVQSLARTWYMNVYRPPGGLTAASFRQNIMAAGGAGGKILKYLSWGLSPKRLLFFLIERKVLRQKLPARIIAVSGMVRSHLKEFYDVPDEKIAVVYNGVDTEKFHPRLRGNFRAKMRRRLNIEESDFVIMTAAHNFKLKGVRFLIELAGELARRGFGAFRILIVGKDKDGRFRARARALGVEDRALFAGAADNIVPYYGCADLFILATFYDPCSNAALEALAMGLPVVTTVFNGVSELMSEGKEGYVLSHPGQVQRMADIVIGLRDEKKRNEMGRAARDLAERHTLAGHVERITALYEQVIAGERKNA